MAINILITGANGQLGHELLNIAVNAKATELNYSFTFADKSMLDITDKAAIEACCERNAITYIINCAAYTAVDKAESEPEKADAINHMAVKNLAEVAKARSIALVHISTDYVFDGATDKPYKETDTPNPINEYGKSKLLGEQALQQINPANSIIIRTSWLYSRFGNNFVKTMLKLGQERSELNIVADQKGSPTNAADLAKVVMQVLPKLNNKNVEVYHYSNQGHCSWCDFAKAIFEVAQINCQVHAITTSEYPTPAQRPKNSVLNTEKIQQAFALETLSWRSSLLQCVE